MRRNKKQRQKFVFLKQTSKDVEKVFRDIGGIDMSYDEVKELCRDEWKNDDSKNFYNETFENFQGEFCICKENRLEFFIECIPETNCS